MSPYGCLAHQLVNICYRNKSRKNDLGWLGGGELGEVEQVMKGRHQSTIFLPPDLCKRSPVTFIAGLGGWKWVGSGKGEMCSAALGL